MAFLYPSFGCYRLKNLLSEKGIILNSSTVQSVLKKNELGNKKQRYLSLEKRCLLNGIPLTKEQIEFINKQKKPIAFQQIESSKPGELLSQDNLYIGKIKGIGCIYLHTVVDTFSSYGFVHLATTKKPENSVEILENKVVPFYKKENIATKNLLTDNGTEFCGRNQHLFEMCLRKNELLHKRTAVNRPQSNGFVERFHRTLLEEFIGIAFRIKYYHSIDSLQNDLDKWLEYYNYERSHLGYRNVGRTPYQTLQLFSTNKE